LLIRARRENLFSICAPLYWLRWVLPDYDWILYVPIEKLRLANHILSQPASLTIPKVYYSEVSIGRQQTPFLPNKALK
jgi:hypothetical protein